MSRQILEALEEEIARLERVRAILTGSKKSSGKKPALVKPRRTMSPEARRAIGEAQRKRWEKVHAAS